jgi:putative hydrolase of the HAD superfamily
MKTIILDMYGVIMKAPEGDLIPYIREKNPALNDEIINSAWKEAAFGRKTSREFFMSLGFLEDIDDMEKEYLDTVEIDEGFSAIVNELKQTYQLVLLSNDISEWSLFLRNKYRLNEYFDLVVVSGDHGILKPDAAIFNMILDRMNLRASDCLYVDDREKNLKAAKQLGMSAVLFNRRKIDYRGITVNNFKELKSYIDKL